MILQTDENLPFLVKTLYLVLFRTPAFPVIVRFIVPGLLFPAYYPPTSVFVLFCFFSPNCVIFMRSVPKLVLL